LNKKATGQSKLPSASTFFTGGYLGWHHERGTRRGDTTGAASPDS
jgi:hypothetical protein